MNQESDSKLKVLNDELKIEQQKYKILNALRETANKEADKFLAQSEKLTVASINKEIEMYNQLAKAVANAKAGKMTGFVTTGAATEARANANIAGVNITISGNTFVGEGGAEDFLNKSLMPVVNANLNK